MLVLLPPSEGKARPAEGAPADLAALSFPALTARRAALLDALEGLARGPLDAALTALGLSSRQAGEVAADGELRRAPAAPACEVYTGVLYERLKLSELPATAHDHVVIASALWGALSPADRIPAYKLSMGARLPGMGGLAAYWRPALKEALPDTGLIVDLRSGAYAAAWRPRHATVVAVRAFAERPDGSRSVISHMAKRVRGDVGRVLLQDPARHRTPADLVEALAAAGMRAELGDGTLDVVEQAATG